MTSELPPRRLVLASSLADKADYSKTEFSEFTHEYLSREIVIACLTAWMGGRARKIAAMVPIRKEMVENLPESFINRRLRSVIVSALASNSYTVGPVNRLPR